MTSSLCVQFLRLNQWARELALALASPADQRHHEPLPKGGSVPVHDHEDHFVYLMVGKATFSVVENGQIAQSNVLGDDENLNAVVIPRGVMHQWDDADEGAQIHDVRGLEKIAQILQAQVSPACPCAVG